MNIFWKVAAPGILSGPAAFAYSLIETGLNSGGGFWQATPEPLISENMSDVLVFLLLWTVVYAAIYWGWRKGQLSSTRGIPTMLACFAYLVSILVMAGFPVMDRYDAGSWLLLNGFFDSRLRESRGRWKSRQRLECDDPSIAF